MKKLFSWMITVGFFAAFAWWINPNLLSDFSFEKNEPDRVMAAWKRQESNVVVQFDARVVLLMPDLVDVVTAQQFIVELDNGHRLLVSHNLDESSPVPLAATSKVHIKGEYDWTESGGMIHWTHKDRSGKRAGGWIAYDGIRYQ